MAHDDIDGDLRLLVAQSPPDLRGLIGTVRSVCAGTLGLAALPSETPGGQADPAVAEFAEQFSVDVAGITDEQRARLSAALGAATFPAVVQIYLADFLPRVRAGLQALGLPVPWDRAPVWDPAADAVDIVFTRLLPGVARLRHLDPVSTEVVRLRGAAAHQCRLCRSLRESTALEAGGSETLYDDIAHYENSALLSAGQRAALRYVDALVWTPAHIPADVAAGVLAHFSADQARELTLDVMRNASNKIAVALKADAPHVEQGTEQYRIDADGQTVFTSRSL